MGVCFVLCTPTFCPLPWSGEQTDGENRVVVADHCIIHAHALAPSSSVWQLDHAAWATIKPYMFHISNGKLSLPVCSCGFRHRKSNTHSSLAFLHHHIPLTYPPPPHLFIYFFTSFTPLSVWSTFPFHPSSSSFSPEKVDLWLSLLRSFIGVSQQPGDKGQPKCHNVSKFCLCADASAWKETDIQSSARESWNTAEDGWTDGGWQGGWGRRRGGGWGLVL